VTYRFAKFLLDSDTRQLFADGAELHLSPKAFELLLLLIQHRSRALTKAELQDWLWPSTFVGETNLATLVAEIRRTLEDSPNVSRYVRTVHRFGYRFVGAIDEEMRPDRGPRSDVRMFLSFGERRFPLSDGGFVIGRAPEAAIQIDSGGVSRLHARITVVGREARVEDLGSKNGTFVGGQPVAGARVLADGDELRIGPVALTFTIVAAEPTETMP
jgi:DNA-binding winged helix-turn-helix (wHTH) protein